MTEEETATGPLTDDDAAAMRRKRFGALPARVDPDDVVESVDTGTAPDMREPIEPRREWG